MSVENFSINHEKVKLRYRERYLSDGANEKSLALVRGCFRGFLPRSSTIANTSIWLGVDPLTLGLDEDSFAVFANRNDGSPNYDGWAVSVRETADVELDLSGTSLMPIPSGVTYLYVYILAVYQTGAVTTATYNVSDEDPTNALSANYDSNAILIGRIPVTPTDTTIDFDITTPAVYADVVAARKLPVPTSVQSESSLVIGDDRWGHYDSVSRWRTPTENQKLAMDAAAAHDGTHPFAVLVSANLLPLEVDCSGSASPVNGLVVRAGQYGRAIWAIGENGIAGQFNGGDAVAASGNTGGVAVSIIGGDGDGSGDGGAGAIITGGAGGATGDGGAGGVFQGGVSSAGVGGIGIQSTGSGVSPGGLFTGGATNGAGVRGVGTGNGTGFIGVGAGSGNGGDFVGGSSSGAGVIAYGGGSSNGIGVYGLGGGASIITASLAVGAGVYGIGALTGDRAGVFGYGGADDGHGVIGLGSGEGYGMLALGAGASDPGGFSGIGLVSVGSTSENGFGIRAIGGGDGAGLYCSGGSTGSPLRIKPGASPTGGLAVGCVNMAASGHLMEYRGPVTTAFRYVGCQAWMHLRTGSGVPYNDDNIGFSATLSYETTPNRVRCTFDTAFSNTNYTTLVTLNGSNLEFGIAYTQTTTYVDIAVVDTAGAVVDVSTLVRRINIACFGK